MSSSPNQERLRAEMLALSSERVQAVGTWAAIKSEWHLLEIEKLGHFGECACGHTPIIEACHMLNTVTRGQLIIGNVCVKRFLDDQAGLIFSNINRLMKDPFKSVSESVARRAFQERTINKWEFEFLLDTCKKRGLSIRQEKIRADLAHKVIRRYSKPMASEFMAAYRRAAELNRRAAW